MSIDTDYEMRYKAVMEWFEDTPNKVFVTVWNFNRTVKRWTEKDCGITWSTLLSVYNVCKKDARLHFDAWTEMDYGK